MEKIKIVKSLFNGTMAKRVKVAERKLAKAGGRKIRSIDVEDACILYNRNEWFKNKIGQFGKPVPGQFIVVVYYHEAAAAAPKIAKPNLKHMIEKVKKTPVVELKNPVREISTAAAKQKALLIGLNTKNNSYLIPSSGKLIHFSPDYNLGLAS
jgi:benzoyl-CoA reductase/2-hydroxyglutaryl-CoA dehydratase subunit BcrC/BadD/HgdB